MKLGEVLKLNKISKIDIEDLKKYKISGVQNYGQGIVIRREVFGSELNMKKYQVISKNQLMWCKVDTKNGAFGLTHKEHIGSLASTNMALADIDTNKIDPEFLEILFRQKPFADYITNLSSGTTNRKYLTPKQLFDVVKLPDLILQEQKRFVEKLKRIEALKIESEIQTQKQLLTNLKQAILQEAIQGKLTQDWRTRHPELVEGQHSAEHLLQRIKAEKAQLIKEGKLKKEKPLPKITQEEIPFEIPKGWVWCRLGDISHTITKGSSPKWQGVQYVDEGVLFITSENVGTNEILLKRKKYVQEKFNEIEPRSILEKGDILTNIVGASIGRTTLWNLDFVANINQAVCLIRFPDNYFNKQFLINIQNSDFGLKLMMDNQFDTGRGNLSLGAVSNFKIPSPPLEEQKAIVEKVEILMQKCTALEAEIKQSETNAQMLMQAVLKEAFEG
jgi:type I restriction enzyme S subunit